MKNISIFNTHQEKQSKTGKAQQYFSQLDRSDNTRKNVIAVVCHFPAGSIYILHELRILEEIKERLSKEFLLRLPVKWR